MILKRFECYFLVSVLLFTWINLNLSAAENLIRNGGMEQGEGNPANWGMWGWQMQNAIFRLETGDAHTGKRFATVINNENNDSRFIQEVLVEENTIYRISGWIKTENVGESDDVKGAAICLLEDSTLSSRDIKGTNRDWEYVEYYLKVGKNLLKVTISLSVGGSRKLNTGKASFDDVEMVAVSTIPQGALFMEIEGKPENLPPTPPKENVQLPKEIKRNNQPVPPPSWISNPMFFIVVILVIVLGAAVMILIFTPRSEKKTQLPDPDEKKPEEEIKPDKDLQE